MASGGPRRARDGPEKFYPWESPDGNLWYTAGPNIGCVTPAGRFHEIALPLPGYANDITLGPNGALWFTEAMFDRVGRISLN